MRRHRVAPGGGKGRRDDTSRAERIADDVAGEAREVEFEPENDVFIGDDGDDDNGNNNEIIGQISSVSDNSLVVAGQTITVNANTLIDDSIIEAASGIEIANDLPFGSLTETLQQLLPVGLNVEVGVVNNNGLVAVYIEDL